MKTASDNRTKVVVLGGGMAAMTAAFELSNQPDWQKKYTITIHQIGWRLGGQCASGRGEHGRVEEPGLHAMMGAYDNTFSLMRQCYDQLRRPASHPLARWQDAFIPNDLMILHEDADRDYAPWRITFPRNSMTPGDGQLLVGPVQLIKMLRGWLAMAGKVLTRAALTRSMPSEQLRQWRVMADLAGTSLRGVIRDRVVTRGLESLDEQDLRAWLRRHGASEETLASPPVRSAYDLLFSDKDLSKPDSGLAAGTAIRVLMRWLGAYKGSVGYWMRGGTGDVLFTPIYELLLKRGVKFEFFHKVKNLAPSADGMRIDRISIGVQAAVRGARYDPLVDVRGMACWPSQPLWEQLKGGGKLRDAGVDFESSWDRTPEVKTLELQRGVDFDKIVLGIGIGAFPHICAELIDRSQRWQEMVAHVRTTPTIGYQVWSDSARPEAPYMMNTGTAPLTGCSDMSHLLAVEDWPEGDAPKHVLHVCNRLTGVDAPALDGEDHKAAEWRRAGAIGRAWLRGPGGRVVPGLKPAGVGGETDWQQLHDSAGAEGEARLDAQFWVANVEPTERYVLAVPGSTKFRLRADDTGFANLTVAGTWTRNGLNVGSIEGAVMSGMQASRAVCGFPKRVVGERDFF